MRTKPLIKKKSIFLRIALLAFSLYVIIMLVHVQVKVSDSKKEKEALRQEHIEKLNRNEELKDKTGNEEAFMEQEAYEQGNAYPNDQFYVDTPGS